MYWNKGYFFGTQLFYFTKNLHDIWDNTPSLNIFFRKLILYRFELSFIYKNCKYETFLFCQTYSNRIIIKPLNIIFSQIHSVNHKYYDLYKFHIIRLFLIKSYRGKCHALGKPVRGQRTWSNAWNSFNINKTLRNFITQTSRQYAKSKVNIKFNFKVLQKKYISKRKNKIKEIKKPVYIWF